MSIEEQRETKQKALQTQRYKAQQSALKASEQAESKKSDQGLGSGASVEQRRESQNRVRRVKSKASERARQTKAKQTLEKGTVKAATTGPPKPAQPKRSALTKPKTLYQDIVQGFYDKSGKLPSQTQQVKYLKSQGIENARKFKANSVGEALNRVAYVASEIAGGGVREVTLGLSGSLGVEKRGGQVLQVTGGLLTPSALDYAVGAVASKLAKTKAGQKLITKAYHTKLRLLNKVDDLGITEGNIAVIERAPNYIDEDKFTMEQYRYMNRVFGKISKSEKAPKEIAEFASDNVRLFESIAGKGQPSTTERREAAKAIRKLNDLLLDETGLPKKIYGEKINGITVEEISHLPKKTLEELMGDTLKYYRENPDAPRQYVINKNPETDLFRKTIDEIGYFDDSYIDMLKDPRGKIDPNLVASVLLYLGPEERAKVLEDVADYNLSKTVPGLSSSIETVTETDTETEQEQEQPPSGGLGEIEEQDVIEITEPKEDTITVTETTEDIIEEPIIEEIIETPSLKLSPKEVKDRKGLNLRIYAGPRKKWRVIADGKTKLVDARGVVDALNKAQKLVKIKDADRIVVELVTTK